MARSRLVGRRCGSKVGSLARRGLPLAAGLLSLPLAVVGAQGGGGKVVSQQEYEGWRQYSVHCARCHGQDVLGNPVAANLLTSVGPGGNMAEEGPFTKVVLEGRPSGGMPGLKGSMTPEQVAAVYTYVKGRADEKIPPGRPRKSAE